MMIQGFNEFNYDYNDDSMSNDNEIKHNNVDEIDIFESSNNNRFENFALDLNDYDDDKDLFINKNLLDKMEDISEKGSLIKKKRKREYLYDDNGPNYKIENDKVIRLKKKLTREERKEISVIRNRISARKSRQKKKDEVMHLRNIICYLLYLIEQSNEKASNCRNCKDRIINIDDIQQEIINGYKKNDDEINTSNNNTNNITNNTNKSIIIQNNSGRYSSFINKILISLLGMVCIITFFSNPSITKITNFSLENHKNTLSNTNTNKIRNLNSNNILNTNNSTNDQTIIIINNNVSSSSINDYDYYNHQIDLYRYKRIAVNNLLPIIKQNNNEYEYKYKYKLFNNTNNINNINKIINRLKFNLLNNNNKYKFLSDDKINKNNESTPVIFGYNNYPQCVFYNNISYNYNYINNYNLSIIEDQELFGDIAKIVYSIELKENGYNFINYFNNIKDFNDLFIKETKTKSESIFFQVLIPHKLNGMDIYHELLLKPIQINTIFK